MVQFVNGVFACEFEWGGLAWFAHLGRLGSGIALIPPVKPQWYSFRISPVEDDPRFARDFPPVSRTTLNRKEVSSSFDRIVGGRRKKTVDTKVTYDVFNASKGELGCWIGSFRLKPGCNCSNCF